MSVEHCILQQNRWPLFIPGWLNCNSSGTNIVFLLPGKKSYFQRNGFQWMSVLIIISDKSKYNIDKMSKRKVKQNCCSFHSLFSSYSFTFPQRTQVRLKLSSAIQLKGKAERKAYNTYWRMWFRMATLKQCRFPLRNEFIGGHFSHHNIQLSLSTAFGRHSRRRCEHTYTHNIIIGFSLAIKLSFGVIILYSIRNFPMQFLWNWTAPFWQQTKNMPFVHMRPLLNFVIKYSFSN